MDPITRMMIDGQQAFAIIGTTLWVMLRIGAMLMAMPMVGSGAVPARVRGACPSRPHPTPVLRRSDCRRRGPGPQDHRPERGA